MANMRRGVGASNAIMLKGGRTIYSKTMPNGHCDLEKGARKLVGGYFVSLAGRA